MELTANEQLVHQMYIAYYQRPADPEGLQYWVDQIKLHGGWAPVSAAFGAPENPEYQALYGDKERAELVAELYQSAFNREAAAEEIAFWVESEHSDLDLAFAIINGAQNDDLLTVNAKVEFSALLVDQLKTNEAYLQLADPKALLAAVTKETEVTEEYVSDAIESGTGGIPGLTAALANLQAANAGVASAAEALNDYLDEAGIDPVAATEEGVAEAREVVQEKFDAVVDARDNLRDTTVKQVQVENATLHTGVAKYLGTNQALTEANLTAAKEGVQAEINASTAVFLADGSASTEKEVTFDLNTGDNNLLDLSGIDVKKSGDITITLAAFGTSGEPNENNKDANNGGGKDTIILPDLADYQGKLVIENMILGQNAAKGFDTLVAPGLADAFDTLVVAPSNDGTTVDTNGYLTFTLSRDGGEAGSIEFTSLIRSGTLFNKMLADGDIVYNNDTNGNGGQYELVVAGGTNGKIDNVTQAGDAPSFETGFTASFATVLSGLEPADFVELLQDYGNLVNRASTSGLEKVGFTLAELQQEMLDAEAALESARDANSDADLLGNVTAAINAYLGAGGDDLDVGGQSDADLLALRAAIRDELNADGDDLAVVDVTRDALLAALAGGNAVVTGAEAPTTFPGQGSWTNTGTEDQPEWTYQPTSEEQGLLDALAAVEAREALIAAETNTAKAFADDTVGGEQLGAQLLAIEDRLEALAAAEQAVVDAEAELNDANELIDALEAALAELEEAEAWFTDQGMTLPVSLDGDLTATEDSDIFLFVEDTDGAFTITGFGEEGVDSIFFGAEAAYALVSLAELGEGVTIEDRVGDNGALEIFWEQSGNDLILYVEADTAAGFDRDDLALDQMTQITLKGVSAEDIDFDGQILTAGVAAEQNVEVA